MSGLRAIQAIVVALVLCPWQALAQTSPAPGPPPPPAEQATDEWSLFASAYAYFTPDGLDYVQPTVMADRGRLHLQARYNYEDLDTGSVWAGCNFSGGTTLAWEIAPMAGGVFGNTLGVAVGYLGSLSWRAIEFVSEGEYVANTGDPSDSFTYAWSELTVAPAGWFRAGLAVQNTWAGEGSDVEPGILLGFSYKNADLAAYVFNPGEDEPTTIVAVSVSF